jgi:hypothetical protein
MRARYEWDLSNTLEAFIQPQVSPIRHRSSRTLSRSTSSNWKATRCSIFRLALRAALGASRSTARTCSTTRAQISGNFVFDRARISTNRPLTIGMQRQLRLLIQQFPAKRAAGASLDGFTSTALLCRDKQWQTRRTAQGSANGLAGQRFRKRAGASGKSAGRAAKRCRSAVSLPLSQVSLSRAAHSEAEKHLGALHQECPNMGAPGRKRATWHSLLGTRPKRWRLLPRATRFNPALTASWREQAKLAELATGRNARRPQKRNAQLQRAFFASRAS